MTADELVDVARETGLDWVGRDHRPRPRAPGPERTGRRARRPSGRPRDRTPRRRRLRAARPPRLRGRTHRARARRRDRAAADRPGSSGAAIVDAVEDRLGVDLGVEPRSGLGRPHIARAIDESSAPYDYAGAFDELIGNDGPCYVAREVTKLERGVELLRDACALVGLAHPFRYDDVGAALDVARELDAVERFYPLRARGRRRTGRAGRCRERSPVDGRYRRARTHSRRRGGTDGGGVRASSGERLPNPIAESP